MPTPIPFLGTAAGPSPWLTFVIDAIGALGAAGAAIVAVYLANRARTEARQQRELAEALDGRLQAVSVTVDVSMSDVAELLDYETRKVGRAWRAVVTNRSTRPVTNLQFRIMTSYAGTTSEGFERVVLPKGEKWEVTTTAHAETTLGSEPIWELYFNDATGEIWNMTQSGGPWKR